MTRPAATQATILWTVASLMRSAKVQTVSRSLGLKFEQQEIPKVKMLGTICSQGNAISLYLCAWGNLDQVVKGKVDLFLLTMLLLSLIQMLCSIRQNLTLEHISLA